MMGMGIVDMIATKEVETLIYMTKFDVESVSKLYRPVEVRGVDDHHQQKRACRHSNNILLPCLEQ